MWTTFSSIHVPSRTVVSYTATTGTLPACLLGKINALAQFGRNMINLSAKWVSIGQDTWSCLYCRMFADHKDGQEYPQMSILRQLHEE